MITYLSAGAEGALGRHERRAAAESVAGIETDIGDIKRKWLPKRIDNHFFITQ